MTGGPVLVTGATGFVGRHLARRLAAAGEPVAALVRPASVARLPAGVQAVPVPESTEPLVDVVGRLRPAVCVHLATHFLPAHRPADVEPLLEANVVLGTRLAEALVAAGPVPLVDTGTVWQHMDGAPFAPANLYAATKQALADILTAYALRHGLPVARLILTDTYGPDDVRPKLVPSLVEAARTGRELALGSGRQTVDLVHVDDVVDAFLVLAAHLARRPGGLAGVGGPVARDPDGAGRGGVTAGAGSGGSPRPEPAPDGTTRYLVSSGAPVTVRELVDRAEEAAGRPLPVRWGGRPDRPVDAGTPRSPDAPLPGWRPRIGLVEGLRPLLRPA